MNDIVTIVIKLPIYTYRAEAIPNMECHTLYRIKKGKDTKVLGYATLGEIKLYLLECGNRVEDVARELEKFNTQEEC